MSDWSYNASGFTPPEPKWGENAFKPSLLRPVILSTIALALFIIGALSILALSGINLRSLNSLAQLKFPGAVVFIILSFPVIYLALRKKKSVHRPYSNDEWLKNYDAPTKKQEIIFKVNEISQVWGTIKGIVDNAGFPLHVTKNENSVTFTMREIQPAPSFAEFLGNLRMRLNPITFEII